MNSLRKKAQTPFVIHKKEKLNKKKTFCVTWVFACSCGG